MNLNGDEKRILQLFREMRSDDRRRAPQFAGLLEAAIAGTARSRDRVWPRRLALAAATLIIVVLAVIALIRNNTTQTAPDSKRQAVVEPVPSPIADPIQPGQPASKVSKRVVKHIRPRRTTGEPTTDMKSLFAWRSPTASLLKTSSEDLLLMSLPRVGESLETIKTFSPELWN